MTVHVVTIPVSRDQVIPSLVELAAAKRIGSETVTHVSNIYKYYSAWTLLRPLS